ncbi:uncharacterized protein BDR25DRAFT_363627 [Lindgomyces ingoldianus]|uniref:Uncharacterized protein n=1 Tax=Lindgomyces ingoldianus TaxID=673940 RepID=A0ACB6Q7C5_9PLEO|nr:uncharacterized protein BDR25DRAFT_363627 [Lindgomyces ingoldianus]KAF2462714.1 hypothetical protein BDR25DRAFT_363627 [Lindgomyces ingoldianus]
MFPNNVPLTTFIIQVTLFCQFWLHLFHLHSQGCSFIAFTTSLHFTIYEMFKIKTLQALAFLLSVARSAVLLRDVAPRQNAQGDVIRMMKCDNLFEIKPDVGGWEQGQAAYWLREIDATPQPNDRVIFDMYTATGDYFYNGANKHYEGTSKGGNAFFVNFDDPGPLRPPDGTPVGQAVFLTRPYNCVTDFTFQYSDSQVLECSGEGCARLSDADVVENSYAAVANACRMGRRVDKVLRSKQGELYQCIKGASPNEHVRQRRRNCMGTVQATKYSECRLLYFLTWVSWSLPGGILHQQLNLVATTLVPTVNSGVSQAVRLLRLVLAAPNSCGRTVHPRYETTLPPSSPKIPPARVLNGI